MAERVEQVTEVREDAPAAGRREVRQTSEATVTGSTLAARIIWFIAGVLLTLLAFRFILTLLGANQNNGFADFIYSASHPFVAPFFSLFGYNMQYGVSKVEIFTLVAMAVYAVVAYGLAKLFTLNRPR